MALQNAPSDAAPQTKAAIAAITNVVNQLTSNGVNGVVTKGQLAKAGVVNIKGGLIVAADSNNQAAMPITIAGLTVSGGFSSVFLAWDAVTQDGYSHVEIWRSQADDIATAKHVGTSVSPIFTDSLQKNLTSEIYYYWVRAVNTNGLHGRFNAVNGAMASTAADPAYLLDVLSGELGTTQLHQDLNSRIDLIDTSGIGLQEVQGLVAIQDKYSADSMLASSLTLHQRQNAHFVNIGNIAQINQTQTQTITDLQAEVSSRLTLEAKLDGATALYSTSSTASVDALQALVSNQSDLQAQIDGNIATLSNLDSIIATPVAAEATKRETLQNAIMGNTLDPNGQSLASLSSGMIFEEKQSRVNAVQSINTTLAVLQGTVDVAGSISNAVNVSKQQANAYADNAVASSEATLRADFTAGDNALTGRLDTVAADVSNLVLVQSDATAASTKEINTAISTFRTEIAPNAEGILLAALGLYDGSSNTFNNQATIQTVSETLATETSALAARADTLQTELNGNTASIQTQQTSIDGINAEYTLKTDVNGKVAGFGLINSGNAAPSVFEINADRFALSNADGSNIFPFVVDTVTGITHIDNASIKDASITAAKIGSVNATSIQAGTIAASISLTAATITGGSLNIAQKFQVSAAGDVIINSSNSGTGARMEITNSAIKVFDTNGVLRVQMGNLTV